MSSEQPASDAEKNEAKLNKSETGTSEQVTITAPPWIISALWSMNGIVFFWVMAGICGIYGIRLFFNYPIHPSFQPIAGAAFATCISFAIVLTLRQMAGSMDFKLSANTSFSGSAGQITFWVLCFLAICFGLSLLGFKNVTLMPYDADGSCQIVTMMVNNEECPYPKSTY